MGGVLCVRGVLCVGSVHINVKCLRSWACSEVHIHVCTLQGTQSEFFFGIIVKFDSFTTLHKSSERY